MTDGIAHRSNVDAVGVKQCVWHRPSGEACKGHFVAGAEGQTRRSLRDELDRLLAQRPGVVAICG
jgi:hypothetical protein